MEILKEFLVGVWALPWVQFMVLHATLNTVVAVSAALRTGEFKPYKLAEFFYRKLAPYVPLYGFAYFIGEDVGLGWLAPAVLLLIEATLLSDLVENLALLGVPIPKQIAELVSKN